MQNTLKFIDSLTNDSINKIRNSKSDAEARRILKETNAEFLQSCVVGQSEQLCKHENYAYTLNNDTKMCYDCFNTFV